MKTLKTASRLGSNMTPFTLKPNEARKLTEVLDYIEGLDPDGSSRGLLEIYNGSLERLHVALWEAGHGDVSE